MLHGDLATDGKMPQDTRTQSQKHSMRTLLEELHARYPKALIVGHYDLEPKKTHCPGFDAVKEFWDLQP